MEYIFLFFLFIIVYVYIGYPVLLKIIILRGKYINKKEITPSVTLFIPAYNEERIIKEKIINSLDIDYPRDKLEIVVASDGSTDSTVSIIKNFRERGVILFEAPERRGKNFIINEFIPNCIGEIIVFTDANSFYKEDTIKKVVRNFSDERVGCVVGNLRYVDEKTLVGKGEGLYFHYESMIKGLENRLGTVVAATGSIYAIRRSLFNPLDLDIANDFAHPIHIASKGYKIVFEHEALAFEKATSSTAEEFKRRSRIVTRGITAFLRYWRSYGMLKGMWGFCFISHKLLRWFIPFFMIGLFLFNLFLLSSPFYKFVLFGQLGFYLTALVGYLLKKRVRRFLTAPFYFSLVNLAAFVGILKYFLGKRQKIWETAKTTR